MVRNNDSLRADFGLQAVLTMVVLICCYGWMDDGWDSIEI
jgi:hypothetical protein